MNAAQLERLGEHLLKLRLFKSRERLEALLQDAAARELAYSDFLEQVLSEEEDRVVIRSNGEPTYFASDLGYLLSRFERRVPMSREDFPPLVVRQRHGFGAKSADPLQLGLGCSVGAHDRARGTAPPRRPSQSLRHVSRTGCVHAGGQLFGSHERHSVVGAAELERTDGLKVFQLEV